MAGLLVVNGAILTCPLGSPTPGALTVTSQAIESVAGLPLATTADCVSLVNIASFGTCSLVTARRRRQTACIPTLAGTWMPGSVSHTVDGIAALTATDTLICTYGGTIAVANPGQVLVTAE